MAKNKGKAVMSEPQKLQTLEENVREIDQRLSDFMSEIYDSQQQTKAFLDQRLALFYQKFDQLIEMLQAGVRLNVLPLKDPSVLNPQMSKVLAAGVLGKFSKQSAQEVKNQHVVFADAEEVKNDNMTQAIKKVLIKNFPDEEETQPQVLLYKNLWLEAEAALCSITYMARFSRMKTEMEKDHLQMTGEKSTDAESPSRSDQSPGSSTFENLEAVVKCSRVANSLVQDSVATGAGSQMNLMTRYKVHDSKSMNAIEEDAKNDSWSKVSPDLDKVNKLSTEKIKGSPTANINQEFPASNTASQLDHVDALVMAIFNILKFRDENSSSIDAE